MTIVHVQIILHMLSWLLNYMSMYIYTSVWITRLHLALNSWCKCKSETLEERKNNEWYWNRYVYIYRIFLFSENKPYLIHYWKTRTADYQESKINNICERYVSSKQKISASFETLLFRFFPFNNNNNRRFDWK